MRFRLSTWGISFVFAAAALVAGVIAFARLDPQAGPEGVQRLEPGGGYTNVIRTAARKDGLRQLEEDLTKTLQGFAPKGSLDGVLAPVRPPVQRNTPVVSQRTLEKLDKEKNWSFVRPEDFGEKSLSASEMMNVTEYDEKGQPRKPVSTMDRFFQDLVKRKEGKTGPGSEEDRTGLPKGYEKEEHGEDRLPGTLGDTEKKLRGLLSSDSKPQEFSSLKPQSSFNDMFGLGEGYKLPSQMAPKPSPMDQYKHILEPPRYNPPIPGVSLPGSGLPGIAARNDMPPVIGPMNPNLSIAPPQSVNNQVLNQWNALYAPPKVAPPRQAVRVQPVDAARRGF